MKRSLLNLRTLSKSTTAAILGLSAITTGCMSFSSMESAKPLGKDKSEFVTSGGYTRYSADEVSVSLPYVEAGYRYGITDSTDISVKYTLPGAIEVGAKQHVYGDNKLNVSVGGKLGYSSVAVVDNFMATIPAYIGYDLNDRLELTATPQYRLLNSSFAGDSEYSATVHYLGTGLGARFGEDKGVLAEVSILKPVAYTIDGKTETGDEFDDAIIQFAVGFFLK